MGGTNIYQYAPNPMGWIDPLGLAKCPSLSPKAARRKAMRAAGVPTSRGNIGRKRDSAIPVQGYNPNKSKPNQQFYQNHKGDTMVVSQHPKDKDYDCEYIHVSLPKGKENGVYKTFENGATKYKSSGTVQEFGSG
jgi:uncharacterized protein RhaS with RHS repeats